MKLSTSNQAVEVSGGTRASTFSIAVNHKAFRVLSDTLYQNKIGSVVREICCNAYDAHVAADKQGTPFEVHLPDNFEPWFAVKDFGIGLSDEAIRKVFTVYFESTKDDSNDAIGAFGLGAKTPFSYTDQFTVTSCYNGTKSIYSAFIGPAGVPDMQLMLQQPTQEQNGVEIKMSVRSQDFITFEKELRDQLRFFSVKPIVKNKRNFAFYEPEEMQFEDSHVSVCKSTGYGNNIYIVQGQVGYLMQSSTLAGKLTSEAEAVLQPLVSKNRKVYLKFAIGEIGVTASREGVEYDSKTVSSIDAKLRAIGTSFAAITQSELDKIDNEWDKACYFQANNPFGNCRSNPKIFSAGTQFDNYGNVQYDIYDLMFAIGADKKPVRQFDLRSRFSHESKTRLSPGHKFSADSTTAFVIKDKCTHSNRRLDKLIAENPSIKLFRIFESLSGWMDSSFKNKLQAAIGGCKQIYNLSDVVMDKAEKIKYTRKSTTAEWYKFDGSIESTNFVRQFTYVEDIAEEKLYVYFSNRSYHHSDDIALVAKYNNLRKFNDDLPELIACRFIQKDTVEKNKNLIPLKDFIAKVNEEDYVDLKIQWKKQVVSSRIKALWVPVVVQSNLKEFVSNVPDSKLTKFLTFADKNSDNAVSNKAQNAASFFGWSASSVKRADAIEASYKKTLDSLPFIKVYFQNVSSWTSSGIKIQDVVNYVKYVPH